MCESPHEQSGSRDGKRQIQYTQDGWQTFVLRLDRSEALKCFYCRIDATQVHSGAETRKSFLVLQRPTCPDPPFGAIRRLHAPSSVPKCLRASATLERETPLL